jgi:hypothetical protein
MKRKKILIPEINQENMTVKDMIFCVDLLRDILKQYTYNQSDDKYDDMMESIGGKVHLAWKYVEAE